jgi:signal transduction histidine kinase
MGFAPAASAKVHSRALYWIPMSVLALGCLSMALLVWTRQIDQRRADDAALANVVMDLRIRVATAHLWTEQVRSGATSRGERALAESTLLDVAHLADVLRAGGEGKDLLVVSPPSDPEVQRRCEELGRLTAEWLTHTRERLRRSQAGLEASTVDDRAQSAFDTLQHKASDLERIVETEQVADIARSRRLFQGLLFAWSIITVASTMSLLHRERARAKAVDELRAGGERLTQMVADRTRALRSVNAALLTAQETERRRISTELHDQLGHALILMKFRFARIARELRADQSKARTECAELCGDIDQTLEDVRRLSRDLRPSVLEELGLSAGLRWLANNSGRDGHPVAAAIADVDPLVTRDHQVIVYRVVQQALTNAARHSHANEVSLHVTRDRDRLWFVVQDDGQGFDMTQVATMGPAHGGLGLATMQERASMVGGSLEVWSATGKGTRVTLGVPVPQQETT